MAKYYKKQQIAINVLENKSLIYSKHTLPLLIKDIILQRPNYLPLYIQIYEEHVNTKIVADTFSLECYNLMTNDKERVIAYNKWIDYTWNQLNQLNQLNQVNQRQQRWLEIGPGNDICLSKLLLEPHNDVFYVGIETNKIAYKNAFKKLQKYKNAHIQNGFVNEFYYNNLPPNMDVVLHEILGVIGSSEGVGLVMSIIKNKYPNIISIPEKVTTHLVLLDLNVNDIINDNRLTINYKLFRGTIPFDKCQISDDHGILEVLNMTDIELLQTHQSKYKIKFDGFLSVIGIYINVTSYEIWTSSNKDDIHPSTNWANIGLVLSEKIAVKKNKMAYITSDIDIRSNEPKYNILLKYESYQYQWDICYSDLYGKYEYLHTIKI